MKKDIVCGLEVKEDAKHTTLHGGRKLYFCSHECQQKFIHEPGKYMKEETKEETTKAA